MSNSHTHSHPSMFHGRDYISPSHSHDNSHGLHCENQISHSHFHDDSGLHSSDPNADANKRHYDGEASTYDGHPQAVAMAHTQSQSLLQIYPFDREVTTVMDYACGTGLISRALAPHVKSIVGVDISQGMVDQYNKRANDQGVAPEEMKAVCTGLKGEEGELDGQKFDVIVCAMAYHHFSSIDSVTRTLSFFLKPGGSLMVSDMMKPEDDSEHEIPEHVRHIVPHSYAFSEEDMRSVYQNAGLDEFTFSKMGSVNMRGKEVDFFIAKGTKR